MEHHVFFLGHVYMQCYGLLFADWLIWRCDTFNLGEQIWRTLSFCYLIILKNIKLLYQYIQVPVIEKTIA